MKWRRITVDGAEYRWTFGRGSGEVRDENNKKVVVLSGHKMRGFHEWERGRAKRTTDGMITPRDVATAIRSNSK